MKVGDLVLRTDTFRVSPGKQWKAVVTKVLSEFSVEIVWLDTFDRDKCSKSLLALISASR